MKRSFHRLALAALACTAALCIASAARAEQADKDKPVNFTADQVDANYEHRTATLKGNVVLTQGTMTVRGDRIEFKQNDDNSVSAKVWGNPLSFRQKKDGSDEYYEGYAQRAVYDGQKEFLELFDRALLKQGNDEIRSNYISYNTSTGVFTAEGRPDQPGAPQGPGARVRGTFQPREEGVPGSKGGAAKGAAPKAPAKAESAPKAPAAPLTLTPESALKK